MLLYGWYGEFNQSESRLKCKSRWKSPWKCEWVFDARLGVWG